jgi:hypothetical protein
MIKNNIYVLNKCLIDLCLFYECGIWYVITTVFFFDKNIGVKSPFYVIRTIHVMSDSNSAENERFNTHHLLDEGGKKGQTYGYGIPPSNV